MNSQKRSPKGLRYTYRFVFFEYIRREKSNFINLKGILIMRKIPEHIHNSFYEFYNKFVGTGNPTISGSKKGGYYTILNSSSNEEWTLELWYENWPKNRIDNWVYAICVCTSCEKIKELQGNFNCSDNKYYSKETYEVCSQSSSYKFHGKSYNEVFFQKYNDENFFISLYVNPAAPTESLEIFFNNELVKQFLEKESSGIFEKITETMRLTQARIGQGEYRRQMLEYWENQCAISDCAIPKFLRASHAMPWKDCEKADDKLSKYNGLALAPNYDEFFDKGYIAFTDDGQIMISRLIDANQRIAYGLTDDMHIRNGKLTDEHRKYLKYHREHIWVDKDENPS